MVTIIRRTGIRRQRLLAAPCDRAYGILIPISSTRIQKDKTRKAADGEPLCSGTRNSTIDQLDKANIVLQRHFQDVRTFLSSPLFSYQVLTLQFCCDHSHSIRRDGHGFQLRKMKRIKSALGAGHGEASAITLVFLFGVVPVVRESCYLQVSTFVSVDFVLEFLTDLSQCSLIPISYFIL